MLTATQFQAWCRTLQLPPHTCQLLTTIRASRPVRRVGSRAGNVSGAYASRKMGCTIQFESHKVELWAIYSMEHDPQVLEYYDQPLQLDLTYTAKSGRTTRVKHTPDFLVLTSDGVWLEEWKPEDKLLALASAQPQRYQRDAQGLWHCPPGEDAAARLGLRYRVRSSAQMSPHAMRNLIFLDEYGAAPEVDPATAQDVIDRVRSTPGLSVAALRAQVPQVSLDAVFTFITRGQLYVDLAAAPLIDHDAVHLYANRATAEAHALLLASQVPTTASAAARPSQPLALTANRRLLWDGRLFTLLNLGQTTATLQPETGAFPQRHAVWQLGDLYEYLCEWAYQIYEQTLHATLGVTPREAYVTGLELGGARSHRRIAYDAEFLMATLPAPRHKTAKVMPGQGVKVHYLFYWHEALRHPEVERTRVPVRYDPFDIGVVYAYVHGQWVPCRSQYYAAFVGHSEKELALATAVLRQQARMSHRAASITPIRLAEFFAQVHAHERVLVQRLRDQEAHAVFEGMAAGIEGRTAREPSARPAPAPAAAHASMGATDLCDPVDLSTLPTFEEYR